MKFLEFLKEVWKQNKINYFIACGVLIVSILFLNVMKKIPNDTLIFSIPFAIGSCFILMYGVAFLIGGDN